jgi:electron transport complex protein RnfA
MSTALGMGGAVILVITLASAMTWAIKMYMLEPLGLGYFQTVAFILAIAALVQLIDIAMKRYMPSLHAGLGIFLPLLTTNCAMLGVVVINAKEGYGFFKAVLFGFSAAVGFAFALLIFAGLRERIERADPPRCFKGVALSLITAGILSLAFMGFSGLV